MHCSRAPPFEAWQNRNVVDDVFIALEEERAEFEHENHHAAIVTLSMIVCSVSTSASRMIWRTIAMTPGQSPGVSWVTRRMVGYHGVSSRPVSQRQQRQLDNMAMAGRPSAPARCSTAVSTDTTMSTC